MSNKNLNNSKKGRPVGQGFFFVLSLGILVALSASCGKKCICTYYEDGKKVLAYEEDEGSRYFEKSLCEDQSVKPYNDESIVTPNKEVTVEVKCK